MFIVFSLFRSLLRPLTRPLMRLILGMIAIPTFRLFLRRVVKLQDLDEELEKDLEQWFRASLVLMAATANMEELLFGWLPGIGDASEAIGEEVADDGRIKLDWIVLGGRILLAIGVIETMPDQELFSIIYPGPPHLKFRRGEVISTLLENWRPYLKGMICQHINRSSPVFAILSTVFHGSVGWIFYLIAIIQYLVIGLVTSREHAMDVLSEFDKQVTIRRRELMEEFDLKETDKAQPPPEESASTTDAQPEEKEPPPTAQPAPESPAD